MTTRCECGQPSVLPRHEQGTHYDNGCAACRKKEEHMRSDTRIRRREQRTHWKEIQVACDAALARRGLIP